DHLQERHLHEAEHGPQDRRRDQKREAGAEEGRGAQALRARRTDRAAV
ncbi:MAG: hypothetical protein AVDCRST_MAG25-723, partial [uncultured Rubrobacteraceae bacterium]